MKLVLEEVRPVLDLKKQIIVSDAANFTTGMLEEQLAQSGQFFYVIPNIAAEFGASMSFIAKGKDTTDESVKTLEGLYALVGDTLVVETPLVDIGTVHHPTGLCLNNIRSERERGQCNAENINFIMYKLHFRAKVTSSDN